MHLDEIVPCLRELVSLAAVSWDTEPAAVQLGKCRVCLCVCVCVFVCTRKWLHSVLHMFPCCLFLGADDDDDGGSLGHIY